MEGHEEHAKQPVYQYDPFDGGISLSSHSSYLRLSQTTSSLLSSVMNTSVKPQGSCFSSAFPEPFSAGNPNVMPPISPETQSSAHESGKHTPQPEIATWESEHKTDAKTKNVPTGLLDHLDSDQQHNTQCRSTDDAHKSSPPPPDAKMSGSMNEEWVARGGNAPKSPDTPSYSTHNAFESLDQCLSAKNKQSPPPLISLSRSGSDPPNSLKNHSVNLKFLPRASWCPEHDPRSDLLHHHHDVEDLTVDMQRMKITECPWPEKYSRYMYFNADNQQVPWTGAHDNQGKLIPVADDAEDLNYFLQAYPNGRRIIIPGPIRANTSSRLDEVLFLLGGHKLVGVVNEQKADRRSVPLEIRRVLENGTLADADLVPIDHATSGLPIFVSKSTSQAEPDLIAFDTSAKRDIIMHSTMNATEHQSTTTASPQLHPMCDSTTSIATPPQKQRTSTDGQEQRARSPSISLPDVKRTQSYIPIGEDHSYTSANSRKKRRKENGRRTMRSTQTTYVSIKELAEMVASNKAKNMIHSSDDDDSISWKTEEVVAVTSSEKGNLCTHTAEGLTTSDRVVSPAEHGEHGSGLDCENAATTPRDEKDAADHIDLDSTAYNHHHSEAISHHTPRQPSVMTSDRAKDATTTTTTTIKSPCTRDLHYGITDSTDLINGGGGNGVTTMAAAPSSLSTSSSPFFPSANMINVADDSQSQGFSSQIRRCMPSPSPPFSLGPSFLLASLSKTFGHPLPSPCSGIPLQTIPTNNQPPTSAVVTKASYALVASLIPCTTGIDGGGMVATKSWNEQSPHSVGHNCQASASETSASVALNSHAPFADVKAPVPNNTSTACAGLTDLKVDILTSPSRGILPEPHKEQPQERQPSDPTENDTFLDNLWKFLKTVQRRPCHQSKF